MSETPAWTPLGTLAAALGPATATGEPPFPAEIVRAAAEADLGPEEVHLAWELARLAPRATADESRALLLLALAVVAAEHAGSTRVPSGDPRAGDVGPALAGLLAALGASPADRDAVGRLLAQAAARDPLLAPVIGRAGDYRPLLLVDRQLYAQRAWEQERRVVEALAARLLAPPRADSALVDAALEDLRARPARDRNGNAVPLSPEQEAAVRVALGGRLGVLTGGPGTGKTWVVAALLRVVARLGEPRLDEIALAAPTGKAADRLQASLRAALSSIAAPAEADRALLASPPRASTLHRLLLFSPSGERFRHHERNPLAEGLVLVDESSMVGLGLAERLLRALRPDARLVMLGDARQLPSVEAGAVFRDLVAEAAPTGRVARLTRSWRMDPGDPAGSAILTLAAGIADGAPRPASVTSRAAAPDLAFAGAELLPLPPPRLAEFLAVWWRERVVALPGWEALVRREWRADEGRVADEELAALEPLFRHYEASRLLTATRGWSGGTGAAALHAWFHAALSRALGDAARGSGDGAGAGDASAEHAPGEPVLVTRNDYRRGLYNGDQGLVLRVRAPEGVQPMAVLRGGGGFRAFPLPSLRGALEPAWASTVHKAQGSEHDHVAVVLPAVETRLLTRELLYTAVTRARRSVVVVGGWEALAAAASRTVERWSGIGEGLRAATAAPRRGRRAGPDPQLGLPFGD